MNIKLRLSRPQLFFARVTMRIGIYNAVNPACRNSRYYIFLFEEHRDSDRSFCFWNGIVTSQPQRKPITYRYNSPKALQRSAQSLSDRSMNRHSTAKRIELVRQVNEQALYSEAPRARPYISARPVYTHCPLTSPIFHQTNWRSKL